MNREYTILDVGCGDRPRGTTNLDLHKQDVPNFIEGDATSLPFEDNKFNTVYSSGLSLWSKRFSDDKLLDAWREAIRVAKDQVIMEYNYLHNSETWSGRYPLNSLEILKKELTFDIEFGYSSRGKISWLIRPFEKIFGPKMIIFVLNRVIGKSYLAKFKIKLTNKQDLPETTLEVSSN